jgi:riboflavin synthase
MFTGLVDDVGIIQQIERTPDGLEMRVSCRYNDLAPGESIALNGACLTVREHGPQWFTVGAVVTTLGRTTVGSWLEGQRVNLERAMRASDRFGGHFVQGHVDGVALVIDSRMQGDALLVDIEIPGELTQLMVAHGSVTVDGVSLTVNALLEGNRIQLSIIEYTARHTTLGALRAGDRVHVEADILGKYVQRLLLKGVNLKGEGIGDRG